MPGSYTNEEVKKLCQAYEKAGIDAINVTGGWHETRIPQLTFAVPSGAYVYLARSIKEAVDIPVMASNRLGDPIVAEKILRANSADLVCMGRPLIADPFLPEKASSGRLDEIVPCVGCNQVCFDNVFAGQPVGCMLNPMAGHEGEITIEPAADKKKVVVIGGGPAGMKAASVTAARGHKVVLIEERDELGGQLQVVRETPEKEDFGKIITSLVNEVNKAGVEVKTGVRATKETVKNEQPDVVIVATGAEPSTPPIPGIDRFNVVQAWDYIRGDKEAKGKNIVVIGGNATGCEAALLLAKEGTIDSETLSFLFYHEAEEPEKLRERFTRGAKNVTVIDMLPRLADNAGRTTRWALLKDLKNFHVKMMSSTEVTEITDDGVEVKRDEEKAILSADTIILAVGAKSRNELHEELKDEGVDLHLIGDARFPRKIIEAISEGFHTAIKI